MIMFLSGKTLSGNICYFHSNQSQSVIPLFWIAVMLDFVYVIYKLIREFNIDLGKIKQKKCEKMWHQTCLPANLADTNAAQFLYFFRYPPNLLCFLVRWLYCPIYHGILSEQC